MNFVSKEFFTHFLKAALPEFEWVLSEMEKSGGWLNLPQNLVDVFFKLKFQWWLAYDNDRIFNTYQALMFIDVETLKSIQSQEEANALTEALKSDLYDLLKSEEFISSKPYTEEEKKAIVEYLKQMLEKATDVERKEFWQSVAFYWLGFIVTFFDLLALMVHGRSMRQLVASAKGGNDAAYTLAVQVDRTVLFLPYFQQRLQRAQLSKDTVFLDLLGYRLKNPIIKGKIKRRTLWLLFALLDSEGQLDMPLTELLQLCEDVGAYGKEFGVGDENSLSKRRREYRENHGTRKIF